MRGFSGKNAAKIIAILEDDTTKIDLFNDEPAEWFANLGAPDLSAIRSEQTRSLADRSQKAAIQALSEVQRQLVLIDKVAKENSASVISTEKHLKSHSEDLAKFSDQINLALSKQVSHQAELEKLKGRVEQVSSDLKQFSDDLVKSMNSVQARVEKMDGDIRVIRSVTRETNEEQAKSVPIMERLAQTLSFMSLDFNGIMSRLGMRASRQAVSDVFNSSHLNKAV
jgi:chromosome segregation ATPase